MKIEILEALREHGELYADEIAQGQGDCRRFRQLADDFQIYQEQVGMMRDSGKWFLFRRTNCNRAKAFTRRNCTDGSVLKSGGR